MPLPENVEIDEEKLVEIALAILWLGAHGDKLGVRAWKGMDWDLTDLLFEKGWISDPKGKAKSVVLSDNAVDLAEGFFRKHFGKDDGHK